MKNSIPNSPLKTIKYIYKKTKVIIKFHCNTISEWNEEILEELKVEPVDEKFRRYKSNWLQQVTRKNNNRIPIIMLNCRPNVQRRLGSPLKKLLCEAETDLSRPNS